jgi:hypothetical protein
MHWWDRIPKKLIVLVVGVAVQALPISSDAKQHITAAVAAYLLGQGLADVGKERAKIAASSWGPSAADATVGPSSPPPRGPL